MAIENRRHDGLNSPEFHKTFIVCCKRHAYFFTMRPLLFSAIFPIAPGMKSLTVEIRIISTDGLPLAAPFVLEAETYQNGKWTKEAEDVLK